MANSKFLSVICFLCEIFGFRELDFLPALAVMEHDPNFDLEAISFGYSRSGISIFF